MFHCHKAVERWTEHVGRLVAANRITVGPYWNLKSSAFTAAPTTKVKAANSKWIPLYLMSSPGHITKVETVLGISLYYTMARAPQHIVRILKTKKTKSQLQEVPVKRYLLLSSY